MLLINYSSSPPKISQIQATIFECHVMLHVISLLHIGLSSMDNWNQIQDAEKAETMDVVVFEGPPKTEQVLWPTHCVQESWGAEMHKDLKVKNFHICLEPLMSYYKKLCSVRRSARCLNPNNFPYYYTHILRDLGWNWKVFKSPQFCFYVFMNFNVRL